MVEYICPKCRSNRAGVVESSSASQYLRYLCRDRGHTEYVDYCDCDGHGRWIRDSRKESKEVTVDSKPKGIVKQCAVRTNSRFNLKDGALDQALNDGWTVVMCNKITDGLLEYILEKEIKE